MSPWREKGPGTLQAPPQPPRSTFSWNFPLVTDAAATPASGICLKQAHSCPQHEQDQLTRLSGRLRNNWASGDRCAPGGASPSHAIGLKSGPWRTPHYLHPAEPQGICTSFQAQQEMALTGWWAFSCQTEASCPRTQHEPSTEKAERF